MSHLEGNRSHPHVAVRRVAAASMAGMVLRALRPAGDDKEQDLSFLGPQKRRIRSLRNKRGACGRPLVAQRSTGQRKSAALTRRRGARHIDARPGFPAGHRRRRGAGGLSDTVVQRTVHANGVAPVWPGGVASIASRIVARRLNKRARRQTLSLIHISEPTRPY